MVVVPPGTTASCEVRGARRVARDRVARAGRIVEHVDAIVLSGGSAFGLATADGVMHALAERGRGYPTRGGPVPIVPAAAIFDLVTSDGERARARGGPRRAGGRRGGEPFALGRVGAGRGATIGKWRGGEYAVPGGLGSASARDGDVVIGALAVVNAVGDVIGADGAVIAGSSAPEGTPGFAEIRCRSRRASTRR